MVQGKHRAVTLGRMNIAFVSPRLQVFANLGLLKVNSSYYSGSRLRADLDHLDTFYLGQGT
jgi:hypothetical protein